MLHRARTEPFPAFVFHEGDERVNPTLKYSVNVGPKRAFHVSGASVIEILVAWKNDHRSAFSGVVLQTPFNHSDLAVTDSS